MKTDYIIVGCGLAGIAFCEQLKKHNKTFVVYDNKSQVSSTVAGGLYNPVILKRFTPVWQSEVQMDESIPMYINIEKELNVKLDQKIPVYRLFKSIEEQNNWFTASDKPNLNRWLSTKLIKKSNPCTQAKFGFGEVLETGRIDTKLLVEKYRHYLQENNLLITEAFDHDQVIQSDNTITYKSIKTKHIVFAEGFGVKQNPFFKDLPLKGTKGELLIIHAPDLKTDFVLKSSVFLIPLGKDHYIVGSTYNWTDKTNDSTPEARKELLKRLKTFITCEFEVIEQVAGIRPTVSDRRPLVGVHENYKNLFILNGLGTRGVMIAPFIADKLYKLIEDKTPLEPEIDIKRFLR